MYSPRRTLRSSSSSPPACRHRKLNSIEATMQTEGLLKQSQQLAVELQTQQKELQQTNEQLAQKAQQLAEQNAEVERKNQEIEQARGALEEKAKELALTSKYKSEFLANMSHELHASPPSTVFWSSASNWQRTPTITSAASRLNLREPSTEPEQIFSTSSAIFSICRKSSPGQYRSRRKKYSSEA